MIVDEMDSDEDLFVELDVAEVDDLEVLVNQG